MLSAIVSFLGNVNWLDHHQILNRAEGADRSAENAAEQQRKQQRHHEKKSLP